MTHAEANGSARPAAGRTGRPAADAPLPDLSLYERLIADGLADADAKGTAVDHVTARRLAIWLAARPQSPVFARSLVRFVDTGAISDAMRAQLRIHARSGTYADQPQAVRLMRYCISRGTHTGPVGENFGAICDQIDRADVMLARLRNQVRQGLRPPSQQARPQADGPQVIAIARRDPHSQTVSLILDAATANAALFAIATHADEREAHVREVERFGHSLPEGSWGRANRQAIAAREARLAARLRAVEHAYRTAIDHDAALTASQRARTLSFADHVPDWEMEPE
jgi:hypothetical protein